MTKEEPLRNAPCEEHLPEADKYFDIQTPFEISRDKLPHWHQDGKIQFVTFHLYDSMPQKVLVEMQFEKENWLRQHPQPWSTHDSYEFHKRFTLFVDQWLDAGYGSCILAQNSVAEAVEKVLFYHNGKNYCLYDYVIMPNHIHLLIEPINGFTTSEILHSLKSYMASTINKLIQRKGALWRRESFDRLIRDAAHFYKVRKYIEKNIRQGGVRWMGKDEV